MPLTFGRDVLNANDLAQATCIATRGDEPMTVSWTFHGDNITDGLGIMTTPIGGRGSNLLITSINHRHSGVYTCTASNDAGSRSESIELQVNGNSRLVTRRSNYFCMHLSLGIIVLYKYPLLPDKEMNSDEMRCLA